MFMIGIPDPIPAGATTGEKLQTFPNLWIGGYDEKEQTNQILNYLERIGFYGKEEPGLSENAEAALYPALQYTPKGQPILGIEHPGALTFEVQMRIGTMSDLTAVIGYATLPFTSLKTGYNIAKNSDPTPKFIKDTKAAGKERYNTSMQYLAALTQQSNRSVGYSVDLGTLGPFTPAERDKIIDYVLG
jgi:hypothetical protein